MKKNKYVITRNMNYNPYNLKYSKYAKGFDGYLAYEFSDKRTAKKFVTKLQARKELRMLKKDFKDYIYSYKIEKLETKPKR